MATVVVFLKTLPRGTGGRNLVLLHDVVEVLALPNHDVGAVLGVEVTDAGLVRSALIDVDDLGKAVVLDGTRKEPPCCMTISLGGQQEVDGVPLLVNGAIPIPVLTTELDVRLVEAIDKGVGLDVSSINRRPHPVAGQPATRLMARVCV